MSEIRDLLNEEIKSQIKGLPLWKRAVRKSHLR